MTCAECGIALNEDEVARGVCDECMDIDATAEANRSVLGGTRYAKRRLKAARVMLDNIEEEAS